MEYHPCITGFLTCGRESGRGTLLNGDFYEHAYNKEQIIPILMEEADRKKLSSQVVDVMILFYDEIMEKVELESGQILLLHKNWKHSLKRY